MHMKQNNQNKQRWTISSGTSKRTKKTQQLSERRMDDKGMDTNRQRTQNINYKL